mmetsp:Transcript_51505/g.119722  ORF Transcript_51505/g.119722 Transcript_51505/m.119722 type:complete len:92 (+) Transcript_51505:225-500(+)
MSTISASFLNGDHAWATEVQGFPTEQSGVTSDDVKVLSVGWVALGGGPALAQALARLSPRDSCRALRHAPREVINVDIAGDISWVAASRWD